MFIRKSWFSSIVCAAVVCIGITSMASAQPVTFDDWAQAHDIEHGDIMPDWVATSYPKIDSLDGIGNYDWTTFPTTGLNFNQNNITTVKTNAFVGLSKLTRLFLLSNKIATIESGAFNGLDSLNELDLSNNDISSLESGDFAGLASVQSMTLYSNRIRSMGYAAFSGLDTLKTLNLSISGVTDVNAGTFVGLRNLQTLDLTMNRITKIQSNAFTGLGNLDELDIRFCIIDTLEAGAFKGLNNIKTLRLAANSIAMLNDRDFAGLDKIVTLDLAGNDFTELNLTGAALSNLKFLSVDSTEIESLVLDYATISQAALNEICNEAQFITSASLIGTDMGNTFSLEPLVILEDLELITVDEEIYQAYKWELDSWDYAAGHTLTVVPEPATVSILMLGGAFVLRRKRK